MEAGVARGGVRHSGNLGRLSVSTSHEMLALRDLAGWMRLAASGGSRRASCVPRGCSSRTRGAYGSAAHRPTRGGCSAWPSRSDRVARGRAADGLRRARRHLRRRCPRAGGSASDAGDRRSSLGRLRRRVGNGRRSPAAPGEARDRPWSGHVRVRSRLAGAPGAHGAKSAHQPASAGQHGDGHGLRSTRRQHPRSPAHRH